MFILCHTNDNMILAYFVIGQYIVGECMFGFLASQCRIKSENDQLLLFRISNILIDVFFLIPTVVIFIVFTSAYATISCQQRV